MRLAESPNNSAETRALRCPAQDDEETAAARALSGKVGTGFPKRSCSNKKIERDDDSKKSHPALAVTPIIGGETQWDHYGRCRLSVCARQRGPGYAVLLAPVAIGRPCAPSQARTMPASYALLGHDELLP